MPGTEVRIYDVVDPCVAPLVNSPSQACELYGSGTFEDPGCVAVSTALTDAEGKAVFGVPGGAEYYVVGKPPAPNEENKISHTVGFVSGGAFVRKQIQLIIDPLTGEEVPSRNCE